MFTSKHPKIFHSATSPYLFGKFPRGTVTRITQINNYKCRIEFSSGEAANNFILNPDSLFNPYRVYIAAEQVEVDGIVHLSPEDPVDDLLHYGKGQFSEANIPAVKVIDVYRFDKIHRDSDGNSVAKSSTPLVRVTFPGSALPIRVVLDGLLLPVQPYKKKAMTCDHCLRTGHTKTFCVVKPKCAKCGSEHSSDHQMFCLLRPITTQLTDHHGRKSFKPQLTAIFN